MLFFNSSLPRSGSELLQQILTQHPDIYATRTDGSLDLLVSARKRFHSLLQQPQSFPIHTDESLALVASIQESYLLNEACKGQDPETMKKAFRALCKGGIMGWESCEVNRSDTEQMRRAFRAFCKGALNGWAKTLSGDSQYICIKTRGLFEFYEWYMAFLGEQPKVITIIRDLRYVAASLEKQYRKTPDFAHEFPIPSSTSERIKQWFSQAPVGFFMSRLYDAYQRGVRPCVIRYEDLIQNPQQEINKIYKYLNIKRHTHNFNKLPDLPYEKPFAFGPIGNHETREVLNARESNPEEILGLEICQQINEENWWFYNTFYA